jgi:hypothetical protein
MDIWLYVAIVIAPLLVFGWIVDRRAKRLRRGLSSESQRPSAGATTQDTIGAIERIAPGTTLPPTWHHYHSSP